MTTAVTMETGGGAPGTHRRYILDAIRKRLSERLSVTSSISDDECGDAKRIRFETARDKTNSGVGKVASWNSAKQVAANYQTNMHCTGNDIYQQLVGSSMSRDHMPSNTQCCQSMTSLSADELLVKDVSSLCDVTVAAAACSLLQAVGRIHCRDCLQLKASQLSLNQDVDAGAPSRVSRPTSDKTTCNSFTRNGPLCNPVVLAKPNDQACLRTVATGSVNTAIHQSLIAPGVTSFPVAMSSALQPRLVLQPRVPVVTSSMNLPRGVVVNTSLSCKHDVISQPGVARGSVSTSAVAVTSSSTSVINATTQFSNMSTVSEERLAAPGNTTTETPIDDVTARRMRIESMTVAKLRTECRRLRLPITGPKPNLVRRLVQNVDAFAEDNSSVSPSVLASSSTTVPFPTMTSVSGMPSTVTSINRVNFLEAISRLRPAVNFIASCQPPQNNAQQNNASGVNSGSGEKPVWPKGKDGDVNAITSTHHDANQRIDLQPSSETDIVNSAAKTGQHSSSTTESSPIQTKDLEQLSLWQCQQKLIEELRRQLEHSRRAILEARLQKQDSRPTDMKTDVTAAVVDNELHDPLKWSGENVGTKDYLSIEEVNCVYSATSDATQPRREGNNGLGSNSNKNDTYNEIVDLLSGCQQAGHLLDIDDWTDGLNIEWNENEAVDDVTDIGRKSRRSETEEVNYTKVRKQLTLNVKAGQQHQTGAYNSNEELWTNSPPDAASGAASGPQWSWWDWDDFLTPDSNLSETARTDSSSSSLCWDSEGTAFSPTSSHIAERHRANAAESATYARRDLLLSMSAPRHLATGH